MKQLLSYVSQIKTTLILGILMVIFFIGMCSAMKSCSDAKKMSDNNIIALTDTIKYYTTKTGELVASKTLLQGELSTLKLVNDSLYRKVKDMRVSDPTTVINFSGIIDNGKQDTVWIIKNELSQTVTSSDSAHIDIRKDFAFNNEYRTLEGYVSFTDSILGLNIETDKINFEYTAVVEDNKVLIKSDNPYVKYSNITGITIPNTKRKWSIGIGPSVGYGYNFVARQVNPYIGIGINVNYNLFSW